MSDFYDCWQHKIGVIEGCLRGHGAPIEVMQALEWMKQQLTDETDQAETESRLDSVINNAPPPPPRKVAEIHKHPAADTTISREPAKRERWTEEQEDLVISMLRSGSDIASIGDRFPHRPKNSIYSLVNRLKSSGRV